MGRQREFNEQDALDRALDLFWRQGYRSTSYDELVSATGVSRYGLYSAFGDKEGLFHRVLERYDERVMRRRTGRLPESDDPVRGLIDYLETLAADLVADDEARGCLACSTSLEEGRIETTVARHAQSILNDARARIRHAVERAVGNGALRNDAITEGLDAAILSQVISMCTLGRTSLAAELVPAQMAAVRRLIGAYAT